MFETRVERHRILYVFYSFTIVGNKFINMDCKISSASKKRGPFSSLAINYPRNSILVTFHRFANGRSDKNLFFRAHKYYTDKSESEGHKMLSKSLSPRTFRFIMVFDRLSWTRCWGFLSAYLQAGKLFVHFINLQRRTINYKSCRERVFVELARYNNFLHLVDRRKESR